MKAIAKEAKSNPVLPCLVLGRNEDVDAVEAWILENTQLPPDEMEQYEAFKKLADKGRSVNEIADTFGVTELTVKRRLALANLLPAIRKAHANEEIDGRTVTALTLATKDQQEEWLALFQSEEDCASPCGQQLKAWLCGGEHITTDRAIFPIEDYSGAILADLFDENGVFADADLFWTHQNAAIAALRDAYIEKGWTDCEVVDRGRYCARWDYVKATRKESGTVFIEVRDNGEVTAHEGYISEAEHRRREKQASVKNGNAKPAKPEMTGSMTDYIDLHRHAAARAALLGYPGVAVRLAVAHMIAGSRLWTIEAEPQRTRKEATPESVGASKAEAVFAEERAAVAALLGFDTGTETIVRNNGDDWRLASIFARLLALDDDAVLRVLTFVMAESLEAGTATVEALGEAIPTVMGAWWMPDDAFFELLRDKQIVNAMLGECAGWSIADADVSATAKVQKGIIRDTLTGDNDRTPNPDWRPRWAAFPPSAYRDAAGCRPTANHRRITDLFSDAKT